MKLLECMNGILPYLGEDPVSSYSADNPTTSLVESTIKQVHKEMLGDRWWFNTRVVTLYPDTQGKYAKPDTAIAIYDDYQRLEIRGEYIYDLIGNSFTFTDTKLDVVYVELLAFEELPEIAATAIMWEAARRCYLQDFGEETTVQRLDLSAHKALSVLQREHLRHKKYNSVRNSRVARHTAALRG